MKLPEQYSSTARRHRVCTKVRSHELTSVSMPHVFHQPYSLVLMQVNMHSPMEEILVFC